MSGITITGYEIKPEPAKEQFEVGDWVELTDGEQWLKPKSTLTVETIQLCNTKRSNI